MIVADHYEVHLRHYGAVFDGSRSECAAYVRRHGLAGDCAVVPAERAIVVRVEAATAPATDHDPFDHGNGD